MKFTCVIQFHGVGVSYSGRLPAWPVGVGGRQAQGLGDPGSRQGRFGSEAARRAGGQLALPPAGPMKISIQTDPHSNSKGRREDVCSLAYRQERRPTSMGDPPYE